jgi:hypothetical protein
MPGQEGDPFVDAARLRYDGIRQCCIRLSRHGGFPRQDHAAFPRLPSFETECD